MTVEIKFDSNQSFQQEAVASIVDLFQGAEVGSEGFDSEISTDELFSQMAYKNKLRIHRDDLISNLREIQDRVRSTQSGESQLIVPESHRIEIPPEEWPMDFSVEMETGTGKTYVYLKTAIELYLQYGLSKFVIVVPSVAIREGVLATIRATTEHFKENYGGVQFDSYVYDSKNLNRVRQFATSSHLQIMIINIASFNKDENIINRKIDDLKNKAPIDFINSVNPVVIMDEPQKLDGDLSQKAINSLNPLLRLRYSATHKNPHHIVYRLTPIDAYEMKLVKKIDVLAMRADMDLNIPYVELRKVTASSGSVTATIRVNKNENLTQITVKRNTDLMEVTGNKLYEGWIVEDIYAAGDDLPGKIQFTNGRVLHLGSNTGLEKDLLQRAQIRATINDHFETELKLQQWAEMGRIQPTKPLSLFFIDKVANYAFAESKFRIWFEEEYEGVKSLRKFRNLDFPDVKAVHKGYFATSKNEMKDSKEGRGNKEDEEAYFLIMQSKETLLSLDEPVRFIFSHSALAEGWDNPNVFALCNLQETKSEVRRRQQIGRGLRLPVMSNGERCREDDVNHLTVIATESFESFAKNLQKELKEDTGIDFADLVQDKRQRVELVPKDEFWNIEGFQELWDAISIRTEYGLQFDSAPLIDEAIRRLKSFPAISETKFRISKHSIDRIDNLLGVVEGDVRIQDSKFLKQTTRFPDVLGQLSQSTPISRSAIHKIIVGSGRLEEARKNPAEFISQVKSSVFGALAETLKEHQGIKYNPIGSGIEAKWNMEYFTSRIAVAYESKLIPVKKSIYEKIPVDSNIEREFAKQLDARDDIEFFLKLPSWFKIDTPVGAYNPDWAIVRTLEQGDKKVYLVRETKGTSNLDELFRESEVWKVVFGGEHFKSIDVNYKMVKDARDLDKDEYLILPGIGWHGDLRTGQES